jgi:hypothetical protein
MSEVAGFNDTPVMAPDRGMVQDWTRQLLTLVELLEQARRRRGLSAWSAAERAARDHDEFERLAPIRHMTEAETHTFAPDSETTGRAWDGSVLTVQVGPCGPDRWGVRVQATAPGPDGEDTVEYYDLSLDSEDNARRCAGQLATAVSSMRMQTTVDELLTRNSDQIGPARRMTDAEARAFDPGDETIGRVLDGSVLTVQVGPCGPDCWGVRIYAAASDRADEDTVEHYDLSLDTEDNARRCAILLSHSAVASDVAGAINDRVTQREEAVRAAVLETEPRRLARVTAAIREHWRPEVAHAVLTHPRKPGLDNPALPALVHRLYQLELRGYLIPDILGRLPQEKLLESDVRNPCALAEWLVEHMVDTLATNGQFVDEQGFDQDRPDDGLVVDGEVIDHERTRSPRQPAEPDIEQLWRQTLLENVAWPALRDALPAELCTTLRKAPGYDKLVSGLAAKADTGWSLPALLAEAPTERIAGANDPARYLNAVVDNRARANGGPPRRGADQVALEKLVRDTFTPQVAERIIDTPSWPMLIASLHEAEKAGIPAGRMLASLPEEVIATGRKPAAFAARMVSERTARLLQRSRTGNNPEPAPAASPDPNNGGSTRHQVATIVDPIINGTPARQPPSGSDPAVGSAHEDAEAIADEAERAAGYEHATPPEPAPEPAAHDHAAARADDNLAAAERATAAEEREAAAAAALRAQVVLTPPSADTTPTPAPRTTSTVQRTPTPTRTRSRTP